MYLVEAQELNIEIFSLIIFVQMKFFFWSVIVVKSTVRIFNLES